MRNSLASTLSALSNKVDNLESGYIDEGAPVEQFWDAKGGFTLSASPALPSLTFPYATVGVSRVGFCEVVRLLATSTTWDPVSGS